MISTHLLKLDPDVQVEGADGYHMPNPWPDET